MQELILRVSEALVEPVSTAEVAAVMSQIEGQTMRHHASALHSGQVFTL